MATNNVGSSIAPIAVNAQNFVELNLRGALIEETSSLGLAKETIMGPNKLSFLGLQNNDAIELGKDISLKPASKNKSIVENAIVSIQDISSTQIIGVLLNNHSRASFTFGSEEIA
ncbi:hypothetical protein PanWU01x14_182390 [Parasponia andersonii]|uniref:Uncharacterized protein n=1 Tax=Parasponia andersonii TaxID=3476 RepID=A0A2P5C5A2_PARAD|nr:hypothetical protein PanWU01x14_182390 [Parasponia andersonii]